MAAERNTFAEKYKWDLTALFPDGEAFSAAVGEVRKKLDETVAMKPLTAENALEILRAESFISEIFDRLYVFTHLKSDEDKRDSASQKRASEIEMLGVEIGSELSFISPALSALSDEELDKIAAEDGRFSRNVEQIKRLKAHFLSDKEEKLLSEAASFTGDFREIFMMFDNADIAFESVFNERGEEVEMSHGAYSALLQNKNRKVRRDAFRSCYKAYSGHINFLAANYYAYVKKNVFAAKVRNFENPLQKALYGEEITEKAYKTLLSSVEAGLPRLHDYMALRKKLLGGELNMYDMYVPLFETRTAFGYDEAYSVVEKALAPLGKRYGELLEKAKRERWLDVYENKGKRSGAYSWGAYGAHPYVLLNHSGTTHDTFTIAHEMGHALHSYFSNEAQCFEKAGYVIFVAEVASTVNEVLLIKHILETAKGEERKFLLAYYLDMFRTTLFRQTMFAEFEAYAHNEVFEKRPLTVDGMCGKYLELNKKYYGSAPTHNDEIKYEWARIPHFYNAFYVYKYATGLTSAVSIASAVYNKESGAVDRYLGMLSLGGSLPPLDILRTAGVDLETDAPYKKAAAEFDATLRELEKLI